jgi:hypothetical protein
MCDTITVFLEKIDSLYSSDELFRGVFEDYNKLKSILIEIDSLIEMFNIKIAIIKQITMLIGLGFKSLKTGQPITRRFDGHMLHTVFYGNPGVGKSKTALLLAKCWESLGLLKSVNINHNLNNKDLLYKINKNRATFLELYETYKTQTKEKTSNLWKQNVENWESLKFGLKELGDDLTLNIEKSGEITPKPESLITICGREDFVAEYSGQTSIKTSNFLKSNLGKCIIIEEAYLLCHSEADTYGMEAITVLNRFMDEHNEDLIIVFTGYEELLKQTIFKYQPGLKRRCQWFFDIRGYSPEGLANIFKVQVNSMNWNIHPEVNLNEFFTTNMSSFSNFGGDTQKLALHCKLEYSELNFDNLLESDFNMTITQEILSKGFEEYKKHNIC